MPLSRDQRLYYEQQAKMQQQQVDYENMHTRSTIVRGVQGKVSKIDEEMYHPEMRRVSFEKEATIRHHAAGDFLPIKQENPHARMQPPAEVEQGTLPSLHDLGRFVVQLRDGLQAFNRVAFDAETQRSHRNLLRDAPNQNPSVRLIGDSYNNASDPMDTSDDVLNINTKRKRETTSRGSRKKARTGEMDIDDDVPNLANAKRKRENDETFVENMRGSRKKARTRERIYSQPDKKRSRDQAGIAEAGGSKLKKTKTPSRKRFDVDLSGQKRKRLRGGGSRTTKKAKTEMYGMRRASYEPAPTFTLGIADRVKRRTDRQPPQRLGFM